MCGLGIVGWEGGAELGLGHALEVRVDCGCGQRFGLMVSFSWAVGLGEGAEGTDGGETGAMVACHGNTSRLFVLLLHGDTD